MNQNELTRFFDEILAEPQEGQDGNVLASRAALASVLLGENSLESDDAGGTTNRAASDIYDLDAAQCFVDRVSSGILPVPPGLITAVVQINVPSSRKPPLPFPTGIFLAGVGRPLRWPPCWC